MKKSNYFAICLLILAAVGSYFLGSKLSIFFSGALAATATFAFVGIFIIKKIK
ncbi:MAG TPA: hypothetical protein PKY29_04520 [Ferruginibacter sp.]|nr:hypothetical protein [Ferruginibacter sp.]HRQ20553.1 hypothetical protein [Ferruginibacter sp.]